MTRPLIPVWVRTSLCRASRSVMNIYTAFPGSMYVVGGFTSFDGISRNGIARLTTNGTLDASFNPGSGFNGPVRAVVIQSDDKVVVGGAFTAFNGVARTNIARLNTDGSLDTTFVPVEGANGTVYSLALQGSPPALVLPGRQNGNTPDTNVVSVGATAGTLSLTANLKGVPNNLRVYYGDIINNKANAVLLLDTNYTFTLTFNIPFAPTNGFTFNTITIVIDEGQSNSSGWTYNASISTVAAGAEILLGGDFTSVNGVSRNRIALLRQDGSLDPSFSPGTGADGTVYALAVESGGQVLLGGAFSTVDVRSRRGIARLLNDGSLDLTFNPGTGANNIISAITLQSNNQAIIAGSFTNYNGSERKNLARLLTNGVVDTTFMDRTYNEFAGPTNADSFISAVALNLTAISWWVAASPALALLTMTLPNP